MNVTSVERADPILAIKSNFDPQWLGFNASAKVVFFEQLYDGSAAQFWAAHEDDAPSAFEAALACALAAFENVYFPTHAPEALRSIPLSLNEGLTEKLWRLWHRRDPVQLARVSGKDEALALFDQTGFNWSFQWQRAFIFAEPVDVFDRGLVLKDPQELASDDFRALWLAGVEGYLVPGVDGVCAALFAPERRVCNVFAEALDKAVSSSGLPYRNDYIGVSDS